MALKGKWLSNKAWWGSFSWNEAWWRVLFCCVDRPVLCFFLFYQIFNVDRALICSSNEICIQRSQIFAVSLLYVCLQHVCIKRLLIIWLLAVLASAVASFRTARMEGKGEKSEGEGERGQERGSIVSADSYLSQRPSGCVRAAVDGWEPSPEPSFFKSF